MRLAGKGGPPVSAELGHALRGRRAPQKNTERAEEERPAETSGNIMEVRCRKSRLENKMNSVKLKQEDDWVQIKSYVKKPAVNQSAACIYC